MPKILNTQLYKAVLDANASEHGARMTAMDKATENANEILKILRISYNRARQASNYHRTYGDCFRSSRVTGVI